MDPFELTLDELRARRSAKWRTYGPEVLPAFVAEMDVGLAPAVTRALAAAVERGDTGYVAPAGGDLPAAYAGFARRRYGWSVAPEQIAIVPDVTAGIVEVLRVHARPGDRVVINPPVYPPFFAAVREAGCEVVEVPLAADGELDLDGVERALAAGARAWVLCNPHNPTGLVLSPDVVGRAAAIAAAHGALVISDEIHAPLTLPGATHTPFGAAAGHGITLASASKAFNLAGLKCAVAIAADDDGLALLARLPDEVRYRAGHLGALASAAAFTEGDAWLDDVLAALDRKRHALADLLRDAVPEVGYRPPSASYLAWLDCRALGLGDDPDATFLQAGVALARGGNFGVQGRGFARLNFGTSDALLEEAVRRMALSLRAAA